MALERTDPVKVFDIGPGVICDPEVLLNTRLLIQANSGAGKSWALRRLLEQTSSQVQQIVIDPEGEFATLRERFDYVLAAKTGGDTLADPRTAKLLAERLLELGVSAILDIYELKAHERVRFVRLFLEALVDAPKRLWHPALIVLDEAHVYAPEKGSAESLQAVIDLSTRGRKRGFCLVQATQRLSKLHKDAAAEANNKLIGRSALDVDMERAGDELGMTKAGRQVLRDLDAGEFFAFGPALTRTVTRVKVGPVTTSHPKAGSKLAGVVPPPTERVKAVLSKLADLPAEVEQRERTLVELQRDVAAKDRRIKELERATSGFGHRNEAVKSSKGSEDLPPKIREVLTDADRELLRKTSGGMQAMPAALDGELVALVNEATEQFTKRVTDVLDRLMTTHQAHVERTRDEFAARLERAGFTRILEKLERVSVPAGGTSDGVRMAPQLRVSPSRNPGLATPGPTQRAMGELAKHVAAGAASDARTELGTSGAYRMLVALAQHPGAMTASKLALLTGIARTGGTFRTYLGKLKTLGWVEGGGQALAITAAGLAAVGTYEPLPTGAALIAYWQAELGTSGARAMFDAAVAAYPRALTRDELAALTGIAATGGTFRTYLGKLRTMELVERREIKASPVLFQET